MIASFASPPPLGPFLSHFICGRSMAVSHSLHIAADHLFSAPCVVAIPEHFVWQNCLVNLSAVLSRVLIQLTQQVIIKYTHIYSFIKLLRYSAVVTILGEQVMARDGSSGVNFWPHSIADEDK